VGRQGNHQGCQYPACTVHRAAHTVCVQVIALQLCCYWCSARNFKVQQAFLGPRQPEDGRLTVKSPPLKVSPDRPGMYSCPAAGVGAANNTLHHHEAQRISRWGIAEGRTVLDMLRPRTRLHPAPLSCCKAPTHAIRVCCLSTNCRSSQWKTLYGDNNVLCEIDGAACWVQTVGRCTMVSSRGKPCSATGSAKQVHGSTFICSGTR
jgi:hypothetical protein